MREPAAAPRQISRWPVMVGCCKLAHRRFFPGKMIIFREMRAQITCADSR